tara:strand:- start:287 stop:844 length:558 start_codon:yes stop_codon:yes gene_type:complete
MLKHTKNEEGKEIVVDMSDNGHAIYTKSIVVRPIEENDYRFIDKWWKDATGKTPPERSLLPENGLHGLMVCKNNNPVACTYLYLTNSKMGYCDYMIGDPEYREKDRYELILQLMVGAIRTANNLGYEDFWFLTKEEGLLEKCKELGVKVSKEKYHVVTLPANKTKLDCGITSLLNKTNIQNGEKK